jgi:hypothetical protein
MPASWRLSGADRPGDRSTVSIRAMKLLRIFQPRNPLFWLMLVLNTLSYGLAWIVQNRTLNTPGMVLIGGFALANAALGTWLLWRLMKDAEPKPQAEP